MTERNKKAAMIGGAAIVALLVVWLLLRGKGSTVYQSNGGVTLGGVTLPGINLGSRAPFNIPGLPSTGGSNSLSAIGACCSDCAGSVPRTNYSPAVQPPLTIVFNEGAKGGNTYVYMPPSPPPAPNLRGMAFLVT
jgi:hypothetical protein